LGDRGLRSDRERSRRVRESISRESFAGRPWTSGDKELMTSVEVGLPGRPSRGIAHRLVALMQELAKGLGIRLVPISLTAKGEGEVDDGVDVDNRMTNKPNPDDVTRVASCSFPFRLWPACPLSQQTHPAAKWRFSDCSASAI